MSNWILNKGETVRRKDFHKEFGGSGQGGINPSKKTPNIFIFTNRQEGEQHGYLDRWDGEFFLYVGEGQTGNQRMIRGNKAIFNHCEDGRSIRLFWGSRGEVEYGGEFELDHIEPWTTEQATSTDGVMRNVILFRLHELQK
jgi:hypothetical protein